MTYMSFIEVICERLGNKAEVHNIKTRNRKSHPVIVMKISTLENSKIGMVFEMSRYYHEYSQGRTINDIVKEIREIYTVNKSKKENEIMLNDLEKLKDYNQYKSRISLQLMDVEMNRELLELCIWEPFLNLALVPYIDLENKSIIITKGILEAWNVPKEFVFSEAKANTFKLNKVVVMNLDNLLRVMKDVQIEKSNLLIFSNDMHNFGSALLAYDKALEYVGSILGENFWIIPASIHECLIMKESDYLSDVNQILEIVKEMNRSFCKTEEVLTNSIYFYDIEKKKVMLKESD